MAKQKKKSKVVAFTPPPARDTGELIVEGLRQNNLKNLTLRIPHDKITAVVGPSGSGKSSLAFNTLFAEGRWRFIESLSTYTRLFLERMDRPKLDSIKNVRPAIAIEQKNPVRTSRSTVGTATELNDYIRLVYARIGTQHCPECDKVVNESNPSRAAEELIRKDAGKKALIGFNIDLSDTPNETLQSITERLTQRGFIRVIIKDEIIDISTEPLSDDTDIGNTLGVITDRLVLKEDDRKRLLESLETAFDEGQERAWVDVLEDNKENSRTYFSKNMRCDDCDINIEKPSPLLFSFNHPIGACSECKGFGNILSYDDEKIFPDKSISLSEGAIEPWTKPSYKWWYEELEASAAKYRIDLTRPLERLSKRELKIIREGTEDFEGIDGFFKYLETKKYKLHIRVFLSRYKGQFVCTVCEGKRLKKKALHIKLGSINVAELGAMTISEAREFFLNLQLTTTEHEIADEALKQLTQKLEFLVQTGLGYITINRQTRTLSGGEAQRVALTNQLGSALSGVLYVLDEPSIGLHQRDIEMLIQQIKKLAGRANTVVIVEHDASVLRASDHILELGPGSGHLGGRLVYSGPTDEFLENPKTLTSKYLTGALEISVPRWRRKGSGDAIVLTKASGNNLKDITLRVPLKTLTCVTGVSGSGKSTLVMDTLFNALAEELGEKAPKPLPFESLKGASLIRGVRLIDQSPIGKTPRSNPITYIGGFDEVRRFFSTLRAATGAGLSAGSFSFNVPGGRCDTCDGEGVEKLDMYFLPDVYVTCAGCNGKRYKTKVLEVRHESKNINDVLNMTFDEARRFFGHIKKLTQKISILQEVGLGYLKLGQSATTLSGGEAQRLKIARELSEKPIKATKSGDDDTRGFLYILDEPTTGLHTDDIKKLLSVIGRLVDSGNTALIVEHNLDIIKTADFVVDMGPEGGKDGGDIVAQGDPEDIAETKGSHTGRYLKDVLD
jgi:excinuclease ABC subunit A